MQPDPHRPQFHFSARKHWINDPNGLIWFDGEYHLFYQHNPFGDQWGHMSWGHAVSTHLIDWQELPVAIAEDQRVSIYSGSVVVDWHNSSGFGDGFKPPLVAIYTGCLRVPEGGQAQELAYSLDHGRSWTKYAGNPVLGAAVRDFRDPKVFWHAGTAGWVMVLVLPDLRRAQFYGSSNLKKWSLLSEFEAPFEGQGIWECPDLIPLPASNINDSGKWLFKVDALAGHPSGGSGARIFVGSFDGTRFVAEAETAPHWADLGADFYAALSWFNLPPQANGAPARPIWLAWMNCHRYAKHTPTAPWRGAMSLPRELSLRPRCEVTGRDWQLLQRPLPAVADLRDAAFAHAARTLTNTQLALLPKEVDGGRVDGRALDIQLNIERQSAGRAGLLLRQGADQQTQIGYDAEQGVLFVNRSRSGWAPPDDPHFTQRREVVVPPPSPAAPLRLRVLLDRSSVEVFVGEGEIVITELIFPHEGSQGVALFAEAGTAHFGATQLWTLRSAQFT
jgi:fructan beta-fructosidase